ncbi:jg8399 [Pararge aegeria aegeria]|uniref:Jg8399 protein n=1 Tax=Pararge aegeria aegeria TaxID=348720 RepID=A0A8S4SKU0_9NEOP|nr:jg8399 [Pararge aegeria aegeria]
MFFCNHSYTESIFQEFVRNYIKGVIVAETKELIQKGKSKKAAANSIGISESCLRKRLKLNKASDSMGRFKPTIHYLEEKELVQHCKKMDVRYFGLTIYDFIFICQAVYAWHMNMLQSIRLIIVLVRIQRWQAGEFEFIPTRSGKHLLMLDGFTYSQMKQSNNYYCSKKDSGCKARVKLLSEGKISQQSVTIHAHPPPKYMITAKDFCDDENDDRNVYKIPTHRGKFLIMVNGYTYSQMRDTNNYYCSKKNAGCRARVKVSNTGKLIELDFELIPSKRGKQLLVAQGYSYTQVRPDYWRCSSKNKNLKCPATIRLKNGIIIKSNKYHSHPPRKRKSEEALEIKYEIGMSQRGRRLLLIDGYAFSQIKKCYWICSSKIPECKARLQLNEKGEVTSICREHNHPPRIYTRTSEGEMIQTNQYEIVTSRRGKDLILLDGFTFSQYTQRLWICTKYPKCKSKVTRYPDGYLSKLSENHSHFADPLFRTSDGSLQYNVVKSQRGKDLLLVDGFTYSKGGLYRWNCSTHYPALLHYDVVKSQRGKDLLLVEGFTYARGGGYRWICSTHHPSSIKYELVPSQRGRSLVLVGGYTFAKTVGRPKVWSCSTRLPDCKAKLKLNDDESSLPSDCKFIDVTLLVERVVKKIKPRKPSLIKASECESLNSTQGSSDSSLPPDCKMGDNTLLVERVGKKNRNPRKKSVIKACESLDVPQGPSGNTRNTRNQTNKANCTDNKETICDSKMTLRAMEYEIVRSQRGKSLIMVGGYTFAKVRHTKLWTCSTRLADCKAKVKLNDDGVIQKIINIHTHPPREFVRTKDGNYVRI